MSAPHLIARIAGRAVAFAAHEVESVVDLGRPTPTPLAAPGVVGITALRSRVATVVDPRIVLGLTVDREPGARAVVVAVEGHLYAILVESLEDVAEYDSAPLPVGVALGRGWDGVGDTFINRAGAPVLVVALTRLIPPAQTLAA